MKLAVVGTGYAGLVVGTGLAENGHDVICVDSNADRIRSLQNGTTPHYEPGLEELIVRNAEEGRLLFTCDLKEGVDNALLVFICVDTPAGEDGKADVRQVLVVAEAVGKAMDGYRIIALKSASPPGTADEIRDILSRSTTQTFDVVVNPDFLKEGAAVDDFLKPDRIVVGCEDVRVTEIMRELYAPFLRTGKPFIAMGVRSAEMTQYATNAMLAARITMMNQLASICEVNGADIAQVREALASDSRIGPGYLFSGIGYGGPGLPKDMDAAIHMARGSALGSEFLEAIVSVNRRQQEKFMERVLDHYGESVGEKRIALWGVTFKPRTDDIRGAQALYFIDTLLEKGATVVAYDPAGAKKLRQKYDSRVTVAASGYDALDGADGLIIATEWSEFHRPDYDRMGRLMREKVVFDGRNLYTPRVLKDHGFRYFSVGRPPV